MAADDGDLDALLDEALDEFEPVQPAAAKPARAAGDARPPARGVDGEGRVGGDGDSGEDDGAEDQLISDLAASMEQLVETIGKGEDGVLMRQLEEALSQLQVEAGQSEVGAKRAQRAEAGRDPSTAGAPGAAGDPADGSFDPSVEHTLRLLSQSADCLSADADEGGAADDAVGADLLRKLAEGLDELGDSDEFASAVEGMMAQLLSKEVMQEPLQQLEQLFGPWMEANAHTLDEADRSRYEKQRECLAKILEVYEGGEDEEAQSQRVIALMHDMQQHGQPPKEIMKSLAPGSELEALLDGSRGDALKDAPCCVM